MSSGVDPCHGQDDSSSDMCLPTDGREERLHNVCSSACLRNTLRREVRIVYFSVINENNLVLCRALTISQETNTTGLPFFRSCCLISDNVKYLVSQRFANNENSFVQCLFLHYITLVSLEHLVCVTFRPICTLTINLRTFTHLYLSVHLIALS